MRRILLRPMGVLGVCAAMLAIAGCGEGTPVGTEEGLRVGDVARVVSAPAAFGKGRYSRMIGPQGGSISFGVGRIDFPAGAVAAPMEIAAQVDGYTVAVSFSPHGLRFPPGRNPLLVFYTEGVPESGRIYYVSESNVVLEALEGEHAEHGRRIQAKLPHFSRFIFGAD